MPGYAFISNSTKPTYDQLNSREPVKLSNVNRPCIQTALKMGYEVYLGINRANPDKLECELPVHLFDSHTYRSVTAIRDNTIAYKNFSKVVKNGNVEVIHCNTPVGGVIGRLVGKRYRVKKVIYTAHGFHFYKGAPLVNRTIFKWAEQIMAHWTDAIITMNKEDYESAQKFRLKKGGKVFFVHGVGITLSEYEDVIVDREKKRSELGLKISDIVCISAGDLVPRKNYEVAISAIAKTNNPNLHYIICGLGPERDKLEKKAKELSIENQIHFLGFRKDVKELLKSSDIFLFTSLQEGLPRSLMEAMACDLPCVVSNIRGNVDLIKDGEGGYLVDSQNVDMFAKKIDILANDIDVRGKMGKYNKKVIKGYDVDIVKREINSIYKDIL